MRKILSLLSLSLFLISAVCSQEVWPGDVNNNGKVTGVDLLFWGIAYGAEGPARAEQNTDWAPQDLPVLWGDSFPDGLNYAYADCNGDGVVNEDDFDGAIEDNFGEEHLPLGIDSFTNAVANAPRLRLTPSATLVEEGAMVNIGLSLDDTDQPISNFYGLALKLSYTTGLLEGDDGPDFDLTENSWIAIDESYVQELFVDDDGMGTAELAVTRTNQLAVAGSTDQFGSFSIIVEDIIVGLEVDTFYLRIDSVLLIDEHFGITPIIPDTAQIIIAKDTSKLTSAEQLFRQLADQDLVTIYPNPTRDLLRVSSALGIVQVTLIDQYGRAQLLYKGRDPKDHCRLSLNAFRPGLYWLEVRTPEGVLTQKIVIAPD